MGSIFWKQLALKVYTFFFSAQSLGSQVQCCLMGWVYSIACTPSSGMAAKHESLVSQIRF